MNSYKNVQNIDGFSPEPIMKKKSEQQNQPNGP